MSLHDEIKVEIPESAKKPKVEWKFPCYGKAKGQGDILVVYFDKLQHGKVVIANEVYDMTYYATNWNMDYFTPCTLEAKEIK